MRPPLRYCWREPSTQRPGTCGPPIDMKIATFVTLTVVGARRRLAPTVDSRFRGNDEREVIFNRARASRAAEKGVQ
jgi:hypothetical protein